MSSTYACPVHVDRQSADPRLLCPLCGQRPILLRAAADLGADRPAGERPKGTVPEGAGPKPSKSARAGIQNGAPAGQPAPAAELAQELDQAIDLLSRIRDRLRALT